MTNIGARLAVLSLITGLAGLTSAQAQEKKIKREELPPAVEKTVAAQSQGAAIKGFSTEVEEGKTLYEVELTVNGHGKDISMDKDGKIVEVEEESANGFIAIGSHSRAYESSGQRDDYQSGESAETLQARCL